MTTTPQPPQAEVGTIRVRLLLFAAVADAVGVPHGHEIDVRLAAGTTVADLWLALAEKSPEVHRAIEPWLQSATVVRNERIVRPDAALNDDDVVALLPPVSGG